MPPETELSADDDLTRFLVNRAGLLHKLLADQRIWNQAHSVFGPQSTLSVGWIDQEGQVQRTLLTRDFLAGHATVLHAVAADLRRCGPEGQRLVRDILGPAFTHELPGDESSPETLA